MDIRAIETFVAVAKYRSFSQAAKHLLISQPAVSKRIASLERYFHSELLQRFGNRVELSETGKIVLKYGQKICFDLHSCRQDIANLDSSLSGELSIATSHHIAHHYFAKTLRQYQDNFPETSLNFLFLASEETFQSVLDGEVEIALTTLSPRQVNHIRVVKVWEDPMKLVIAKTSDAEPSSRLNNLTALLPAKSTFTRQLIDHTLGEHLADVTVKEVNNLETIKLLVESGLGWSVLPDMMISKETLTVVNETLTVPRQLGIICHQDRSLSNAAKRFIKVFSPRQIQTT